MSQNKFIPDQTHRKLHGIASLNPFLGHNSASRLQMFTSHLGQKLVVDGMTERYCQSGMEQEFGKYTFAVEVPTDCQIIAVIPKYTPGIGADAISHNPITTIVFEDLQTKELDYLDLPYYKSYHSHFGFMYKPQASLNEVRPGAILSKGTKLLDSPGITKDGNYMFGVETNVALMTHPAVSEDGILMSESALKRFAFRTYERVVVGWGKHRFPLNIYGTADRYKIFPEVGEYVRPDRLLMAFRDYNPNLYVIRRSVQSCMQVNEIFDKRIYAEGIEGKVIDIKVDTSGDRRGEPTMMDEQLQKYIRETKQYYYKILEIYKDVVKQRGDNTQLTPKFHRLVVEALVNTEEDKGKISKMHRKAPLDDYRVEFTIEYEIVPRIGFKFTGLSGDKGVVCAVAKDEDMPVDDFGNRAEFVMDPNSRINRMNLGGSIEMYINAASRDLGNKIRDNFGIKRGDKHSRNKVENIFHQEPNKFQWAWDYLVGYWKIIAPKMFEWSSQMSDEERIEELSTICQDHVYLYVPPESSPEYAKALNVLEHSPYRPGISPVEYVGYSGKKVRTKKNVRIASMYIMLLEKIGDDNSTVASGKYQHFGVLAKLTKEDKKTEPYRSQPIKAVGETEGRIFGCYGGPLVVAEIMDRNNNPQTHAEIVKGILKADKPTNITRLIDRDKLPYGNQKPNQIVNHIALCGGWEFDYVTDDQKKKE